MKNTILQDKQIIDSFIKGNNEVIALCFNNWKAEFFLVAYRYMRNKLDSEDVVSFCFEKLIQMPVESRQSKFGNMGVPLKPYLLLMIKNKCLDELKVKNNRKRLDDEIGLLNFNPVINNGPYSLQSENFKSLFSNLPKEEGQMLTMFIDGFSPSEIACDFMLSEKTVRNKISLAKAKMRFLWLKLMEQ